MKFSELKAELDAGKFRNLYIFTGEEREVMNRYIKRISPTNLKGKSFVDILGQLTTKNLFSPQQTYLLEDDKSVMDYEMKDIKRLVGKNTLILVFKTVDKRQKFFKNAEKDLVEFAKFASNQLVGFVKKVLPEVPDNLASLIAAYSGNDVARIENECNKLAMLGKPVTIELIQELIEPPLEDRIFDMIDHVAKKKRYDTFILYYDLIELKESPIKIISLLYTKFKHVFLVQSMMQMQNTEIAGKTGLTFFQVNQARGLVGAFTMDEILEFLKKIQTVEVQMKTGEIPIELGMEKLLVDILV